MDGPVGAPLGSAPVAPLFAPTAGMFVQVVTLMERIRNTAGYTTAIGEDPGIVSPPGAPVLGDPTFTLVVLPNSEVRVVWGHGPAGTAPLPDSLSAPRRSGGRLLGGGDGDHGAVRDGLGERKIATGTAARLSPQR